MSVTETFTIFQENELRVCLPNIVNIGMVELFYQFQTWHEIPWNYVKGDYPGTRASDSKHLPAVILNDFFSMNILGLCVISLYRFKKSSFTMVLCEKTLWNVEQY